MKKIQLAVLAVVALALIFQAPAFAKVISGTVAAVNAEKSTLTISQQDEMTGGTTEATVTVSPEAILTGIEKLGDLTAGAEVEVNAEQDAATGEWKASEITKKSEEASSAAPLGEAAAPASAQ